MVDRGVSQAYPVARGQRAAHRAHGEREQVRILYKIAGWCIAGVLLLARSTCARHNHGDPRPALRADGRCFVYAILHAHQIGAMYVSDDRIGAMVSASKDGDLLAPSLVARGLVPARGSTGKRKSTGKRDGDKGGGAALGVLLSLLRRGIPALLAVDGPQGPRGVVHQGAAILAHETGSPVIPAVAVPTKRWILSGTWDRFQIPKPFSAVHVFYGEPIEPGADGGQAYTSAAIGRALDALEAEHDPEEYAICQSLTR